LKENRERSETSNTEPQDVIRFRNGHATEAPKMRFEFRGSSRINKWRKDLLRHSPALNAIGVGHVLVSQVGDKAIAFL